jgi:hypothetical protein
MIGGPSTHRYFIHLALTASCSSASTSRTLVKVPRAWAGGAPKPGGLLKLDLPQHCPASTKDEYARDVCIPP